MTKGTTTQELFMVQTNKIEIKLKTPCQHQKQLSSLKNLPDEYAYGKGQQKGD